MSQEFNCNRHEDMWQADRMGNAFFLPQCDPIRAHDACDQDRVCDSGAHTIQIAGALFEPRGHASRSAQTTASTARGTFSHGHTAHTVCARWPTIGSRRGANRIQFMDLIREDRRESLRATVLR